MRFRRGRFFVTESPDVSKVGPFFCAVAEPDEAGGRVELDLNDDAEVVEAILEERQEHTINPLFGIK